VVIEDSQLGWIGPQQFVSCIVVYDMAERLAPFSAPVTAIDVAHTFCEHLRHVVVTLRVAGRIITVAEGFFVENENLAMWSAVLDMLRLHAPSLMTSARRLITDRFAGLDDLLTGFQEMHGTAGNLICVFHVLGNVLRQCGPLRDNNCLFWELVDSRNQKEMAENWGALRAEYPEHADYLAEIDASKLIACEIAATGAVTDKIRTSNSAEQENSRQKTLGLRAMCAPRAIEMALGVAVSALEKIRAELEGHQGVGQERQRRVSGVDQDGGQGLGERALVHVGQGDVYWRQPRAQDYGRGGHGGQDVHAVLCVCAVRAPVPPRARLCRELWPVQAGRVAGLL